MSLAGVDEEHLAGADLARRSAVIEVKPAFGDDERDRDGVAMLGNVLSRFEPQADDAHRSAVSDLLEAEWSTRSARRER